MKNILVAVDFSENSAKALQAAAALAQGTDISVYVLHAYQLYIPDVPHEASTLSFYGETEAKYKQKLQEQVAELQAKGIKSEGIWGTEGLVESIQAAVQEKNIDMVVLGRTGTGGFLDKLFGSMATKVIKELKDTPVLIIPPTATINTFKELVYATQLEYEENANVAATVSLAKEIGARLTFLKVSALTQPNIQDDVQYLDQLKENFDLTDDDFVLREAGSITKGIADYIEEINADMVVLATRERGILEQLLVNPSVSKQWVLETKVPTLVYHLAD